uniref:Cyclin-dependent kinase 2 homolog n=1 Tax=Aplanochytrium stocchinoi TaxID=215587 RepID=A0A7S3V0A9_9STRA|mmetsp:Transcript_6397/g.7755  ORF Transcript_6397/g.7755 Transcript_6397/m.7755 type:complete len:459 (+) Transcript_6397:138-1514(+)|eukprot:CAMPEP_0204832446 /NCGR_PEP_ID=MMETSP1346-20131115/13702_1 /ASSEMBLY_ACC=CAM_ASM_000771 /TAXON_ID=215587 /ORGANISM="Aplanochytrium stocchinoi, Strain GSBS06" /LENGTH=458 /DNA_ID=CAMNT_0051964261 /DNA_START=103 /DNA_END=1479 /DNA_ORIENTATION=-
MGRWSSSESEEDRETSSRRVSSKHQRQKVRERKSDTDTKEALRGGKRRKTESSVQTSIQSIPEKAKVNESTVFTFSPSVCRSVFEYEMIGRSGEGTYGVVYKAKDMTSGKVVALKQVKMKKALCREGFPITTLRETNVLLALQHPNIVGVQSMVVEDIDLVGADQNKKIETRDDDTDEEADYGPFRVYMVMDYWEHELKALMEAQPEPFKQAEVKCIMKQLLEALSFMHGKFYIHRDLKTSNILYNNDGTVAICDFGLARKYEEPPQGKYTQLVITLHYRPPELLLGAEEYSTKVDIWSMGCIFAELLQGKVLLYGKSELEQLDKIFMLLGSPTEENWPGVSKLKLFSKFERSTGKQKRSMLDSLFPRSTVTGGPYLSPVGVDLLGKMLTLDPATRITAAEALKHPWFDEFPFPKPKDEMPKFHSIYKSSQPKEQKEEESHSRGGHGGLFAHANKFQM